MSFSDIIKNSVISEFSGEFSFTKVVISILLAFVIALFIIFIYKATFRGVVFNKGFALSLVLLSVVTAAIIMTVTANLALSLGMVGALSIVRFRTAIKDPLDLLYLFWAITTGITSGAGMYLLVVATAVIMIIMIIF